jgi:hypothetical protein
MAWNWAALIAALLAGGTALYIRLRRRRAPQAFTAMVAVAACSFVAGAVIGAWILHLVGPRARKATRATPLSTTNRSVAAPLPTDRHTDFQFAWRVSMAVHRTVDC